jgi:H2-forming N5,N10-methylenetetrahydromethanopterin dehydrogenase-like enzyme
MYISFIHELDYKKENLNIIKYIFINTNKLYLLSELKKISQIKNCNEVKKENIQKHIQKQNESKIIKILNYLIESNQMNNLFNKIKDICETDYINELEQFNKEFIQEFYNKNNLCEELKELNNLEKKRKELYEKNKISDKEFERIFGTINIHIFSEDNKMEKEYKEFCKKSNIL